ncbi:hypothetical protein C4K68_19260 [Pokkaliibacter plantistimulans]|uniref:DNA repair protein n=1 Tax=Proteobacteria bacterium 228 TaxID=2083153 RepID=A0A2S5KLJ1_9PROT|nr:hypothetical protein C4K68_19260 [Pokkaliibacter plantistimulans]
MTATQIAIIIVLGVVALIIMAMIGQSVENNRAKKRQRVIAIKDQVRHVHTNLQQTPEGYVPTPLRNALLQLLIARLHELKSLDAKDPLPDSLLGELRAELEESKQQSTGDEPAPILYSEKQAVLIKRQLSQLSQLVKSLYEQRLFNHQQAQHYIQHLKLTSRQISLDIAWLTAQQYDQRGNWKAAKTALAQCLSGYQQLSKYCNMDERIRAITQRLEQLKAVQEKVILEQKEQLEDQLKRIADEENKWRIKQDYED